MAQQQQLFFARVLVQRGYKSVCQWHKCYIYELWLHYYEVLRIIYYEVYYSCYTGDMALQPPAQ